MDKNGEFTIDNDVTMRSGAQAVLGRIDQYELLKELGGGGFGTVYLARDAVSGVEVAVKGLPPLVKNNKEELESIRANFALVSRLHHPNIAAALVLHPARSVSYEDKGVAENLRVFGGDTLMVMEYAPGTTLSQWRKQFPDGKVPFGQAIAIVRQIASALDYAHEQKIIHRDIKPSNVMIETRTDGSLVARVLDFGLAAEIHSSMGRISQEIHDKSGTRRYMAPEQWLGGRQDPATDQYSLAVLFCELITGEVPFASVFETGDPVVMMNAVGREKPRFSGKLAGCVQKALLRALAKAPAERFVSCGTFVRELNRNRLSCVGGLGFFGVCIVFLLVVSVAVAAFVGWDRSSPKRNAPVSGVETNPNATNRTPIVIPAPPHKPKVQQQEIERAWTVFQTATNAVFTITNDVKMVFVPMAEGTNGPFVGATEVTQRQWLALIGRNPSRNKASLSHPVENVSMCMCQKYSAELSKRFADCGWRFRLMRSGEWRSLCACNGGTYHWGNDVWDASGNDMANFKIDSSSAQGTTKPVGSHSVNLRGIFDLHGNVAEWTEDGKICGGAYLNAADDCTVAAAVQVPEQVDKGYPHVGFRLVAERVDMLDLP